MLGKLYHVIAVVSIAIVLAGGGLLAVLYGTGRLTAERLETIAHLLRAGADAQTATAPGTPESQPAAAGGAARLASAEELRAQQRDSQLRRALTERARRDLAAQRELLDRALQDLIVREERFAAEVQAQKSELEQRSGKVRDEGFEKELKIVQKLPAKLAKEHVIRKWKQSPADAVRLLNALPESASKRIFGQMTAGEELQIMHELLERLASEKVDRLTDGPGTTAGN